MLEARQPARGSVCNRSRCAYSSRGGGVEDICCSETSGVGRVAIPSFLSLFEHKCKQPNQKSKCSDYNVRSYSARGLTSPPPLNPRIHLDRPTPIAPAYAIWPTHVGPLLVLPSPPPFLLLFTPPPIPREILTRLLRVAPPRAADLRRRGRRPSTCP